ncbi:Rieske (2Fe-2S) protein [Streptomyces actinomycinicus]|uniref:Cytochrome bc1 complex Rieske iron-sulfur subunit n=1 Tax=Streptomyces actinomycinicus TaxID=1695166 RepID=A0A937JQ01_9ACTN|nr:Rieske (2Fe-2S) protein [Streptomyces actinomycinicus]MBL1086200.1 Rieske (2Fe-2S) protein [Streptomyces actinomycinicus]
MTQPATRRTVLATGAGALALGCVGCGGTTDESGSTSSESTSGRLPASPAGKQLADTSDIPEGGGKVFKEQKIVVTQPKKGDFKAFSAVCTHQGCTVNKVADGTIDCPCHGSRFRIADGSVAHGPATRPLAKESITVHGNSIHLA